MTSAPTGQPRFDVVVLGTGAAGLVTALAAAEGGASVGLFEKAHRVGGPAASLAAGGRWNPSSSRSANSAAGPIG